MGTHSELLTFSLTLNACERLLGRQSLSCLAGISCEDFTIWRTWVVSWQKFLVPTTFSSVQFSPSVVSDSLRPHESQHARPPCPSPSPGVHSDSRPSSPWCQPAISSSVILFSCPQSLPASKSFSMSQLFAWDGQSTGVSVLAFTAP